MFTLCFSFGYYNNKLLLAIAARLAVDSEDLRNVLISTTGAQPGREDSRTMPFNMVATVAIEQL